MVTNNYYPRRFETINSKARRDDCTRIWNLIGILIFREAIVSNSNWISLLCKRLSHNLQSSLHILRKHHIVYRMQERSCKIAFCETYKQYYVFSPCVRIGKLYIVYRMQERSGKIALHLRSFKTPPSGAVMSEEDDADCAFSMRKGVKTNIIISLIVYNLEMRL